MSTFRRASPGPRTTHRRPLRPLSRHRLTALSRSLLRAREESRSSRTWSLSDLRKSSFPRSDPSPAQTLLMDFLPQRLELLLGVARLPRASTSRRLPCRSRRRRTFNPRIRESRRPAPSTQPPTEQGSLLPQCNEAEQIGLAANLQLPPAFGKQIYDSTIAFRTKVGGVHKPSALVDLLTGRPSQ